MECQTAPSDVLDQQARARDDVPSDGGDGLRLPSAYMVDGCPSGWLRQLTAEGGFLVPHTHQHDAGSQVSDLFGQHPFSSIRANELYSYNQNTVAPASCARGGALPDPAGALLSGSGWVAIRIHIIENRNPHY